MLNIKTSLASVFIVRDRVLQSTPTPDIKEAKKMKDAFALINPPYNDFKNQADAFGKAAQDKNKELQEFKKANPADTDGAAKIEAEVLELRNAAEDKAIELSKQAVVIAGNREIFNFIQRKVEDYFTRHYKEKSSDKVESGVAGEDVIDPLVEFCEAVENGTEK